MKILYVTTIGTTMGFFKSIIKDLIDNNHTVDIATNEEGSKVPDYYRDWGCKIFNISTSRSPFSTGNLKAIKQIRNIAKDYDIVHCHTPLAAMATRLGCRKLRKQGLKVFYTAHGFHFYKGAPLKNWLIYYPMEKFCSRFTDTLITINKEDFELARRKMKARQIEYVPGVGIDVNKFASTEINRNAKRKELGIPEDAFVLLSVGELNANKNHQIVIKALARLNNPNIHYLIAGMGNQEDNLEDLAKSNNVNLKLLGYRSDVAELYKTADVNIFPSIREGLGMAALEGMISGLPLICSDNRGSRTYATKKNSITCKYDDANEFAKAINKFMLNADFAELCAINAKTTAQNFSIEIVNKKIKELYAI